jgi:major vault protein
LRAIESYKCEITEKKYKAGETWMIKGPLDFIPPIEIEIVENRKAIPLAENEGVYVRDTRTGEVKLVKGPITYLLS